MSKVRNRIASSDVQGAVEDVVRHLIEDEWKNFNGEPDHIWHSVRMLRDWLGWDKFEDEDEETTAREYEYEVRLGKIEPFTAA